MEQSGTAGARFAEVMRSESNKRSGRTCSAILCAALTWVTAVSAVSQEVVDPERVARGCLMCHQGALRLEGATPEEIASRIRGVVDGNVAHPMPLPPLDPSLIPLLAERLLGE